MRNVSKWPGLEVPVARGGRQRVFADETALYSRRRFRSRKTRLVDAEPERADEGLNKETNLPERPGRKVASEEGKRRVFCNGWAVQDSNL